MKILSGLEGTASAFGGQAIEGLALERAARKWGIFTKPTPPQKGFFKDITSLFSEGPTMLLGASHVETLNISKSTTISNAPQEEGSFLSYNKVQNPHQFEIRMICDGTDTGDMWGNMLPGFVRGFMDKGIADIKKAFIERLDKIVEDTVLYCVSTPEKLYEKTNIIGYRIQRAPDGSSDMLIADITLQEVREAFTTGRLSGRYPQGDPKQKNGTVQPTPVSSIDAKAGVSA